LLQQRKRWAATGVATDSAAALAVGLAAAPSMVSFRLQAHDLTWPASKPADRLLTALLRSVTMLEIAPGPTLGCCTCNARSLSAVAGMRQLRALSLVQLHLSDGALAHPAGLTALQQASFYSLPRLTDTNLAHLAGLTRLTGLFLSAFTSLTDDGLALLPALSSLRTLSLSS
jgi:hypothetical protein